MNESAPRCMGVLNPIKVKITNLKEGKEYTCKVPLFPADLSKGYHDVIITPEIYIDAGDFNFVNSKDYYGLAPGKTTLLKYAFPVTVIDVSSSINPDDGSQEVKEISVVAHFNEDQLKEIYGENSFEYTEMKMKEGEVLPKTKGALTWVSCTYAKDAEIRLYDHLFTVEEPTSEWEKELNPESLITIANAKLDPSVENNIQQAYQMERVAYFCVDPDSTESKIVLNRIVTLKESGLKKVSSNSTVGVGGNRSRKEEMLRLAAEKEVRMKIDPKEYFTSQTDLYSTFDDDGIPTHDKEGKPLSKSLSKKLKKEWQAQKKLFESYKGK